MRNRGRLTDCNCFFTSIAIAVSFFSENARGESLLCADLIGTKLRHQPALKFQPFGLFAVKLKSFAYNQFNGWHDSVLILVHTESTTILYFWLGTPYRAGPYVFTWFVSFESNFSNVKIDALQNARSSIVELPQSSFSSAFRTRYCTGVLNYNREPIEIVINKIKWTALVQFSTSTQARNAWYFLPIWIEIVVWSSNHSELNFSSYFQQIM